MNDATVSAESFIGRERELSELSSALDQTFSGSGCIRFITGEPGIGKTKLVTELARSADEREARVLWGRCWEGEGAPAFWPWIQILRTWARTADQQRLRELGTTLAAIARMVPDLYELLLASGENPAPEREENRFQLFQAVSTLLSSATLDQPLVIILEDLHWADEPSLRLLEFLSPDVSEIPLLLVGTYRDDELHDRLEPKEVLGQAARHGHRIPLRGLSKTDVERLVESLSGHEDKALAEAAHDATGGNALFVHEYLRLALAEGAASRDRPLIPETVRETVRRRLAALDADARRILEVASVLGRSFLLGPLATAASVSRAEALDELDQPIARRLVVQDASGVGAFSFSHSLVRETIFEDLPLRRRSELHFAVGKSLEAFYGPRAAEHAAELAHHFTAALPAGEPGSAYRYSVEAGDNAHAKLAHEEAVRHYRVAAQLSERADRTVVERGQLLISLADCLWRAGESQESAAQAVRAAELGREAGDAALMTRAALTLGGGYFLGSDYAEPVVSLLEEAVSQLDADDPLRIRGLARLGGVLSAVPAAPTKDRIVRGRAYAAEALECAKRSSDPDLLMYALLMRHYALESPLDDDERTKLSDEMLTVAERTGRLEPRLWAHRIRIMDLTRKGDAETAQRLFAHAEPLAAKLREPFYEAMLMFARASFSVLHGRYADAERELDAVERNGIAMAVPTVPEHVIAARAQIWLDTGRYNLLDVPFEGGLGVDRHHLSVQGYLTFLAARAGRPAEAVRRAERLWAWREDWTPVFAVGLIACAETWVVTADHDRAAKSYEELLPYAGRLITMSRPPLPPMGDGSYYLGLLACLLERPEDAARHFEQALELYKRIGSRPYAVRARHRYAEMLLRSRRSDDRERARRLVQHALEDAREIGMSAVIPALEALDETPSTREREPSSKPVSVEGRIVSEGDSWVVHYAGVTARIQDMKGIHYLRQLVTNRGREFHVLDLVAGLATGADTVGSQAPGELGADTGHAGELLDPRAKASYRERVDQLREEIEDARLFGDDMRATRARAELDAISEQLSRAVGLGGRDRRAASTTERARVNVTRTIRATIRRLERSHPDLAGHLDNAVRTGTYCAYEPDPNMNIVWRT